MSGLHKSRLGRYHLSAPYFRFLAPFHDMLTYQPDRVLGYVKDGLRAFVGQTAFEEISREWVLRRGSAGQLPFEPEAVGSHWSASVQTEIAAINWREQQNLLGECKWGLDGIYRQIVGEMIEQKMPKVMAALLYGREGLACAYAVFTLGGVTPAALTELKKHAGIAVELRMLERDLSA
jgi:hypothetical protein